MNNKTNVYTLTEKYDPASIIRESASLLAEHPADHFTQASINEFVDVSDGAHRN